MTDKPKEQPQRREAGESMTAAREARLAAALRANLHRRKAQARGREPDPPRNKPPSP